MIHMVDKAPAPNPDDELAELTRVAEATEANVDRLKEQVARESDVSNAGQDLRVVVANGQAKIATILMAANGH